MLLQAVSSKLVEFMDSKLFVLFVHAYFLLCIFAIAIPNDRFDKIQDMISPLFIGAVAQHGVR